MACNLRGVRLVGKPKDSLWNISCSGARIDKITEYDGNHEESDGRFVTQSLCHAHIHLDKCFLLSHPKYADLDVEKGDFAEALELTSNTFMLQDLAANTFQTLASAKERFTLSDLMERGAALIRESIRFGVTHMRAFVEVDTTVNLLCLEAGLALKEQFKDSCHVQICVFAQDPIYSREDAAVMIDLMRMAAFTPGVEAIGSTPYVEKTEESAKRNINAIIMIATSLGLLLDFHLDYNLDRSQVPMVHHVIAQLKKVHYSQDRMVTLGHCTRLTLFSKSEWQSLKSELGDLPIAFVGLPTSDTFMMGRVSETEGGGERVRGTLQIPSMIKDYGLEGAISINNVGNAFTPQGSCDPLSVAALGIGIYQTGTRTDAELMLQCVSIRAKKAIGLCDSTELELREGCSADFVVFGRRDGSRLDGFRHRKSVQEIVYDAGRERQTVYQGRFVDGEEQ